MSPVACAARCTLHAADTLVRQGGDEFIVLLPGIVDGQQAEARARQFLKQLSPTPLHMAINLSARQFWLATWPRG